MRNISSRTLWIALSVLSLIALVQYFSTEYAEVLSKKIAQAITETETLNISVTVAGEEEK